MENGPRENNLYCGYARPLPPESVLGGRKPGLLGQIPSATASPGYRAPIRGRRWTRPARPAPVPWEASSTSAASFSAMESAPPAAVIVTVVISAGAAGLVSKKTSLGRSRSPTSGSCSYNSAGSQSRKVEYKAGAWKSLSAARIFWFCFLGGGGLGDLGGRISFQQCCEMCQLIYPVHFRTVLQPLS